MQINLSPDSRKHVLSNLAPSCIRIGRQYTIQDMITIVCVFFAKTCNKRLWTHNQATLQPNIRMNTFLGRWKEISRRQPSAMTSHHSATLFQAELFVFLLPERLTHWSSCEWVHGKDDSAKPFMSLMSQSWWIRTVLAIDKHDILIVQDT